MSIPSADLTERSGKKVVRRSRAQVYRLWLAALRSGEYKQASGQLKSSNGFCCLGVVCELARKDGGEQWGTDELTGRPTIGLWWGKLPPYMSAFLNLHAMCSDELISMNDCGLSFDEIADYIEREVMPRANVAKRSTNNSEPKRGQRAK